MIPDDDDETLRPPPQLSGEAAEPPTAGTPREELESTDADRRFAAFLAEDSSGLARERRRVLEEGGEMASDVVGRLNALEFVGSLVGEQPDMPDVLGEYRITGLLGRGGMGSVYEAYQESLDRDVAIKVLSPSFAADLTMRKRFRSEAKLTASLHHQHIVPIYDYGEMAGYMFFAMEKVDGISLDKHIAAARRRGKPFYEPLEAARRFAGVADALGHAHRRRLLHRDVKPGNILVAADGTLALADFGLSKVLAGGHGEASARLTTQGGFLGTLHYASPEQALGKDLSPASDLYSLGVTMFESVAGCLPRQGKNTEALLQAILQEEPRRLRSELPGAPKDLEAVLHKLLQRDPDERYPDGESLARDLRRVADGEPVQIRRQPLWQRIVRRARRNPGMAVATVVAAVLLLVASVLLFGMVEARRESRASQRELFLTEAMAHARTDPGDLGDRVDRLVVLTGRAFDGRSPPSQALEDLDRARALDALDPRPDLYREALLSDPVPEVTADLDAGRGWQVQPGLDLEIIRTFDKSSRGDRAAELRLYQLYVARAAARLTESIADGEGAHTDLILAGFLRPGAFQSKALMLVASLAIGERVETVLARAKVLAYDSPQGGAEIVGELLACASGFCRRPQANMLRIELPYESRVAMFRVAESLLGEVEPAATAAITGAEGDYVATLRSALRAAGNRDPDALEMLLDRAQAQLRSLSAPRGPMRRWAAAEHLLRDPIGVRAPSGLDGTPAPLADVLLGYDALLQLQPDPGWLADARATIERACREAGDDPVAGRVEARLAVVLGRAGVLVPGDDAMAAADRWVAVAPADPEPLFVRAELALLRDRVDRCVDDACRAVQRAVRADAALDRVLGMLEQRAVALPAESPALAAIENARRAFAEVRS